MESHVEVTACRNMYCFLYSKPILNADDFVEMLAIRRQTAYKNFLSSYETVGLFVLNSLNNAFDELIWPKFT